MKEVIKIIFGVLFFILFFALVASIFRCNYSDIARQRIFISVVVVALANYGLNLKDKN